VGPRGAECYFGRDTDYQASVKLNKGHLHLRKPSCLHAKPVIY